MSGCIKRSAWFATTLLSWSLMASSVLAASFDCAKAATKLEKLICSDAELSKLDEELNTAYKNALQDEKQAVSTRQAQKQWMKERNGCSDVDCVKRAYEMRLHGLQKDDESTKHETASLLAQTKVEAQPQLHIEETACLAPKINWRNYEWMLITGNGLPICEEMLAYVKSRSKEAPPPVCPEERVPQNGNWSRPESRILNDAEKQALLHDVPERWRQKPGGPITYEQQIKSTKLLRALRGDITRDGIAESLLAFNSGDDDYRQTCETSKRCARPEKIFKNGIVLFSDSYDLLPMNDEGTQVNWSHRTVYPIQLMGGELIFYKGLPYWMSSVTWSQSSHDNFTHTSMRADDPYSKIFELAEIWTGTGKREDDNNQHFKDVIAVAIDHDPESNNVCRFGYFHRDNLKLNPPKTRR